MVLLKTKTGLTIYIIEQNRVVEYQDYTTSAKIEVKEFKSVEDYACWLTNSNGYENITIAEANIFIERVFERMGFTPQLIPTDTQINNLPF
jgi:hypothetical protein